MRCWRGGWVVIDFQFTQFSHALTRVAPTMMTTADDLAQQRALVLGVDLLFVVGICCGLSLSFYGFVALEALGLVHKQNCNLLLLLVCRCWAVGLLGCWAVGFVF